VRLFWSRQGPRIEALLLDLERAASGPFAQSAALSRFASMVTHEVRNPLSSVKMVIQTLAKNVGGDERTQKRLGIAAREVRTIERILSALSELAHDPLFAPRPADPLGLVHAALHVSELDLQERGTNVAVEIEDGLGPLACDGERVQIALAHLLVNAARALTTSELSLKVLREGAGIRIVLSGSSTGPATPPAGSGISLAMVDKIAREHGGEFSVEESPQGCSYSLLLPAGG
jgi:signal transduction histidine kinase